MGLGNSNIWIENLQKYRGKWVALDEDEKTVVASDEKAKMPIILPSKRV